MDFHPPGGRLMKEESSLYSLLCIFTCFLLFSHMKRHISFYLQRERLSVELRNLFSILHVLEHFSLPGHHLNLTHHRNHSGPRMMTDNRGSILEIWHLFVFVWFMCLFYEHHCHISVLLSMENKNFLWHQWNSFHSSLLILILSFQSNTQHINIS